MAGLLEEVYAEIARLEKDVQFSLTTPRMEVDLQEQVQSDADDIVYAYGATARAKATRREENGGIKATEHILVSASGFDLTVEAKAPLQHAYSYWKNVNAANVVIQGKKNYKQPYPRNYLRENELAKAAEGAIVWALVKMGHDAVETM